MNVRRFAAGTTLLFGVPANPMPEVMADAIGQVVAQTPGICEAYLPQCYIQGDESARQVLVLGIDEPARIQSIMETLIGKMRLVLPELQFIDIMPFTTSSLPPGARVARCKIFEAHRKPWWRFW